MLPTSRETGYLRRYWTGYNGADAYPVQEGPGTLEMALIHRRGCSLILVCLASGPCGAPSNGDRALGAVPDSLIVTAGASSCWQSRQRGCSASARLRSLLNAPNREIARAAHPTATAGAILIGHVRPPDVAGDSPRRKVTAERAAYRELRQLDVEAAPVEGAADVVPVAFPEDRVPVVRAWGNAGRRRVVELEAGRCSGRQERPIG
jgi:hypothetical protein